MNLPKKNKKSYKLTDSAGFTMIELLLVIIIIGIIGGVGGSYYLTSLKRGNDGKRAADLNNLRTALEMYFQDNTSYPDTGGDWQSVSTALSGLKPDYLKQFPSDPGDSQNYLYQGASCSGGTCSCYCLSAQMQIEENERNSISGTDCTTCPDGHKDGTEDECYLVTCP